ncbi:hypothetical protein FOWG_10319 [Fusarium oxysporum f. sp. lycopersici MN25]|nr:hypothetical protein FOWG_10319 [Fusarium oxysporum f. sp. lycopersici MN25]
MRQIRYATTIPQIYNTTVIIGACRVITRNDEESEDSGFDMDQCCWNDARMDMKRVAQLGHRQTWLSAKRAEGFIQTYPSEMIGRILLYIREACEEAKQTPLPTEILIILYGFGNPAIGCHMDCTKDFLDPDAILTPSMILNELPPDGHATLAMRMFAPRPWVESYRLHRHELDKIKIAYPNVYKQAAADGTLAKQTFTEEGVLDYRRSKIHEIKFKYRHYELALWLRQGPKDTDGATIIGDRMLQFMDPYPQETGLQQMSREALLATVVNFRLAMAVLTDNMVAHFKLKRPLDQTCLEWDMPRWLERQSNLTRSNEFYNLFKTEEDIETEAGLLWSGYTRFRLYLRAAHYETYVAEEIINTPRDISNVLVDIERVFDYILDRVEKSASVCKKTVDEAKQEYGDEVLSRSMPRERFESLQNMIQPLYDVVYDGYAVVEPEGNSR